MEERNKPDVGERPRDRSWLPGAIVGLLIVVLALQLLSIWLHYPEPKQSAVEARSEEIELKASPTAPLSGDPRAVDLAAKIIQAIGTPDSQGVSLGDVRIESASEIDTIIVGAALRNSFAAPIERAVGRIELRSAAGELVYQSTCETRSDHIRLLIDNPPPFERASILLEEVRFHTPGFRQEAAP